jgi:hypothetical protein
MASLPMPGLGPTKLGTSKKRSLVGTIIATGGAVASTALDLTKRHKAIDGYGTDGGLYAHPHPEVNIIHFKEAVASYPNSAAPKVTIQAATNECIR